MILAIFSKNIFGFKKIVTHLQKWDASFCVKIFRLNGKRPVDWMMFAFSHFGYGYAYPFIFIFVVIFDYSNTRLILPTGFISFLIEHIAHMLLKNKTKRVRPFNAIPEIKNLMPALDEFSFPSGHAAGAFVMATLLNHLYPFLMIPVYLAALIISVSRVYNGVHYPSDVMAGSFLGFCSARIGILIFF